MHKSEKKGWQSKNCELSVVSYVDDERIITGTVKYDMTKHIDQPRVKKEIDMGKGIKLYVKFKLTDSHKLVDPELF